MLILKRSKATGTSRKTLKKRILVNLRILMFIDPVANHKSEKYRFYVNLRILIFIKTVPKPQEQAKD